MNLITLLLILFYCYHTHNLGNAQADLALAGLWEPKTIRF